MNSDPNSWIPEAERREIEALYEHGKNGRLFSIARPLRCKFKFHNWSKWLTQREGKIVNKDGVQLGWYSELKRVCLGCYDIDYKQRKEY